MAMNRREVISASLIAAAGFIPASAWALEPAVGGEGFTPPFGPRSRVMILNDLGGDIDGLYATAHALLSPSIEIRGIVGTGAVGKQETAQSAVSNANELIKLMKLDRAPAVFEGAPTKLINAATPIRCDGVKALIDEALRTDTTLPLYVTVGGGLTEVASALMLEPRIADKFTLLWIGGDPYPTGGSEYDFNIDRLAAQYVFNETTVPIWQIPSNVYASCQVSDSELLANVAPCGAIGAWLYEKLGETARTLGKFKINSGETYTLGDSPLVLLTALTPWVPTHNGGKLRYDLAGSSLFDEMFAPRIGATGTYELQSGGRRIRAYRNVDTRLMFDDFFAKLRLKYALP